MTHIDAMKQGLGALEVEDMACRYEKEATPEYIAKAITSLRQAIEQAEKPEPVAWMNDSTPAGIFARHKKGAENFGCTIPLYTHPQPKREWVGLTDEEMHECWESPLTPLGMKHARTIEAKLKQKNDYAKENT
jgi:hypothetical protein